MSGKSDKEAADKLGKWATCCVGIAGAVCLIITGHGEVILALAVLWVLFGSL